MTHKQDSVDQHSAYPKWWIVLFILSLAGLFIYLPYYLINKPLPIIPQPTSSIITEQSALQNQVAIENLGKHIFQTKCAVCHGILGEGGIGPNLTDRYWLHGKQADEILKVIQEGALSKGMGAWKNILTAQEIIHARDYVMSLQGTRPEHPKAPQGLFYQD